MATFFDLQLRRNHPVEAIFAATDIAEDNRVAECEAATRIQAAARMRRCRVRFQHVRKCVVDVQRVFRAFLGRRRFFDIAINAAEVSRRSTFDHFATVVQARFRGYYSRKWRSDFYAQRKYLHDVTQQSERVRQAALAAQEEQRNLDAARAADEQRAAFQQAAGGMHHLLSTAVRSGILRPVGANHGHTTVFGSNVEDELRAVPIPRRKFKESLIPPRGATDAASSAPSKLRSGGTSVANKTVGQEPYVKSLQSSAPYDAAHEDARLETAVHERLVSTLHGRGFAPRKVKQQPDPLSLNAGSEYVEVNASTRKGR